jgi:hypothetical protein
MKCTAEAKRWRAQGAAVGRIWVGCAAVTLLHTEVVMTCAELNTLCGGRTCSVCSHQSYLLRPNLLHAFSADRKAASGRPAGAPVAYTQERSLPQVMRAAA